MLTACFCYVMLPRLYDAISFLSRKVMQNKRDDDDDDDDDDLVLS